MQLKPNTLLQGGKYRIVRFIDSGGFGCTYEAEHVMLGKKLAIKEFFVKDFCNRDEATAHVTVGTQSKKGLVNKLRQKFIDEARAICKLHHPNIVTVSDVFEENGTAYFVMDYIEGHSLNEIIDRQGKLSEKKALHYIRQVADALDYVHSNNRLHLDVKPGNIMIDSSDRVILIDFGTSKQYDEQDGENTSTLMGMTRGYAPLEQMGNDVGKFMPATDIYALGATLYKLLTGVTPPSSTLLASGEKLPALPNTVSTSTRQAIADAMQLNKTERPQSVEKFLSLLNREEEDVTVVEVEPKPDPAPSLWVKCLVPLAIIVALGLIMFLPKEDENLESVFQIGEAYYYGRDGKEQSYQEAVKYFCKAADQGYAPAQTYLGACFVDGKGVVCDSTEALKWYRKAEEQGYAGGQNGLGVCYAQGIGVAQDYTEAAKWFRKAAEQGYATAQTNLGRAYMIGQGVVQNYTEAIKWFRKAAEQGYAAGQTFLGICYAEGSGVAQDYTDAVKWFRKAAEQEDAVGQTFLGICYAEGSGVAQDYTDAVKWFRKAAEQGDGMGQYCLGHCYEEGEGVAQSESNAVKWYRKSAEQGIADAKEALERLGY